MAGPGLEYGSQFVERFRLRVDQDRVSSCVGIGLGSLERFVLAPAGDKGFCSSNDDELGENLRGLRCPDLAAVFFDWNQFSTDPCVETAALRVDVVLDANSGYASSFPVVDGAHDVQRISVPRVAIGDDGNRDSLRNVALDR